MPFDRPYSDAPQIHFDGVPRHILDDGDFRWADRLILGLELATIKLESAGLQNRWDSRRVR